MKIYINKINENWVVDRLKKEWIKNNKDINTKSLMRSDIIWIIAPWTWEKINTKYLQSKPVVCSVYHIENQKLDQLYLDNFRKLDGYVDEYLTISNKSKQQIRSLTDKKITSIPFWVNQNIFFYIDKKIELRKSLGFNRNDYLLGSFQRDSEGQDTSKPKMIKGPDRFLEIAKHLNSTKKNLVVVLTGKRRDYLVNELSKAGIKFRVLEMINFKKLNQLYNVLDLYVVSSRVEGGPQAILECSITKTPIISTDVGVSSEILSSKSIFNMENFKDTVPDTEYAYTNSLKYTIPNGMNTFREFFQKFNQKLNA